MPENPVNAKALYNAFPSPPPPVEGWLEGWSYRKSHVIQGSSAGSVTDYQIRITVHYGSGTDSGEHVYLNGKCRTDFGDIRFTDSSGTLLSYFLEEKVNSNYAVFWVKIPSIPASPNTVTIYIYYGNPSATTISNGEATFPWLFDDFANYNINDTPNTTDWDTSGVNANNTITVYYDPEDTSKKCFRIKESGDGTDTKLIGLLKGYRTGFALHFRVWQSRDENTYYSCYENNTIVVTVQYDDGDKRYEWYDGSAYRNFSPTSPTISIGTWYEIIWKVLDTGEEEMIWNINGTDYEGGFRANVTTGINKVAFWLYRLTSFSLYIGGVGQDNRYIFARKFIDPEPSHGAWGNEETNVIVTNENVTPNSGFVGDSVTYSAIVKDGGGNPLPEDFVADLLMNSTVVVDNQSFVAGVYDSGTGELTLVFTVPSLPSGTKTVKLKWEEQTI